MYNIANSLVSMGVDFPRQYNGAVENQKDFTSRLKM